MTEANVPGPVRPAANHLRVCAALLAMMANATKQSPTRQSYALVSDWLDRMATGTDK
jgi:hypothetical protein